MKQPSALPESSNTAFMKNTHLLPRPTALRITPVAAGLARATNKKNHKKKKKKKKRLLTVIVGRRHGLRQPTTWLKLGSPCRDPCKAWGCKHATRHIAPTTSDPSAAIYENRGRCMKQKHDLTINVHVSRRRDHLAQRPHHEVRGYQPYAHATPFRVKRFIGPERQITVPIITSTGRVLRFFGRASGKQRGGNGAP